MKGAISSSGASVSGSVGGQKGSVGVGSNGTVSLGVDFGGAKLGVTNDYGGAGTIGFGGQSVTWGTTGGNIKLGIGGFEVIVEARNCVVVETKKIAGMIVSQRSYPDPGCKPPTPTPTPTSSPTSSPNDGSFKPGETPPFDPKCRYSVSILCLGPGTEYIDCIGYGSSESTQGFSFKTQQPAPGTYGKFGARNKHSWRDYYVYTIVLNPSPVGYVEIRQLGGSRPVAKGDLIKGAGPWYKDDAPKIGSSVTTYGAAYYSDYWTSAHNLNSAQATVFCATFMNQWPMQGWSDYAIKIDQKCPGERDWTPMIPPVLLLTIPRLGLPSAGNRPPMPESCCESLKADIEDIKSVLATKEMLAKKLTFPWRLRMPGGEGDEIITDYPNLARCIAQMIDHLGIHPPKLSIKDINNAIAGDQSINNQFPSATQGFEALMAQVWDANADVDTLTNFLYRLSWLCVQQSMNLAVVSSDIQCIKDMVGGRTKPGTATLVTPFNIGAGVNESSTKGKGFGKGSGGIDQKIDVNTELSTESLLPDFLKIRENPVVIETFDGDKDVVDMLSMLILKVETLLAR